MSKTIRHRKEKRINAISVRSNVILLIVLTLLAALCVLPVLLVVIVSFSSEQSIFLKGYSFFPAEFSLEAYKFFLRLGDQIVRSLCDHPVRDSIRNPVQPCGDHHAVLRAFQTGLSLRTYSHAAASVHHAV